MTTLKKIISSILSLVILYAVCAFLALDLNCLNWWICQTIWGRIICLWLIGIALYPFYYDKTKDI